MTTVFVLHTGNHPIGGTITKRVQFQSGTVAIVKKVKYKFNSNGPMEIRAPVRATNVFILSNSFKD